MNLLYLFKEMMKSVKTEYDMLDNRSKRCVYLTLLLFSSIIGVNIAPRLLKINWTRLFSYSYPMIEKYPVRIY